ncbi:hypothetical protein, partial [Burkholderia glumae]|uniref:hypothetical protein n=1 Tax=Burkholderia glumae TaxID=337 RepID=UPI001E4E4B00
MRIRYALASAQCGRRLPMLAANRGHAAPAIPAMRRCLAGLTHISEPRGNRVEFGQIKGPRRESALEASSKTLLSSSEDVPTDERAAKFEECFVNVG